ncbi:alpha/beta fold hydrolase [Actinoplanes philippinensis]|uniref:alpha/beta fold hydrolase n=1 Tax=Actinoplanes philippinensis TaxID=35752 RepID=UPI0033D4F10B
MSAFGGLIVLFLALIIATDGARNGLTAWLLTFLATTAATLWLGRRHTRRTQLRRLLIVAAAAALTITVCVPTVPTQRRYPADLPFVVTQHWRLATGSRVAVYHYPPAPGVARHATPLVYLHGGPIRGISLLDHTFLRLLARHGYDVYAYEQAGGGRSELLPMKQYTIDRLTTDLGAFIDHLGEEQVDVLGFSSGAIVLIRALADPRQAARVRRAIIAEPGPMDGPTARVDGHPGEPSARGAAAGPRGPRSTYLPRYGVAFGLMRFGLLGFDNGLISQAEGANAFTAADLGSDTASAYCAHDAHRIPSEDSPQNFSFNAAASLRVQQTLIDSPSLAPQLRHSRTPAMLMIAECSAQIRQWATTVLAADPAIERTQYLTDVGHHMWNGLDDNNQRAATVIAGFLEDRPGPLPNYPTRDDIPAFLQDHR